jgi:hypothetical protein
MCRCSSGMLFVEKLKTFSSAQYDLFVYYNCYFRHTVQTLYLSDWLKKIYSRNSLCYGNCEWAGTSGDE